MRITRRHPSTAFLPKYLKRKMKELNRSRRRRAGATKGTTLYKMMARQWWEYGFVEYAMVHPRVCTRLEELMGSNMVRITDRGYMRMLHQRIQQDYTKQQEDVMAHRVDEEIEREKRLVLEGKLRVEEASKELLEYPVFKASQLTKKLIEKRRAARPVIPPCKSYYGPEEDEEEEDGRGSSMQERQHIEQDDELAREKRELLQRVGDISDEYMYSQKDYERLKYESPLVKELKNLQSVEEMYEMAEKIVGSFEGAEEDQQEEQNEMEESQ